MLSSSSSASSTSSKTPITTLMDTIRGDDDIMMCSTPSGIISSNDHDRRSDQNDEKNSASLSLSLLSLNPSQMSVSVSSLLNSTMSSNSKVLNTISSTHSSNNNIDLNSSPSTLISTSTSNNSAASKNDKNNCIKAKNGERNFFQENNDRLHTISSSNSSKMKKEDKKKSTYSMNMSSHGSQSFLNVGRHLMMQQRQQEDESNCNINVDLPDHLIYLEHVISDQLLLNIIESELNIEDCELLENPFLSLLSSRQEDDTAKLIPIREPPLLCEKEKVQYKNYYHHHSHKKTNEIQQTRMKEMTSSSFPKEFTCPLCQELIVGSIILNCGCQRSTFCITCLEEEFHHRINEVKNDREKKDGGYVMVSIKNLLQQQHNRNLHCCPSCDCNVFDATPCHTIDVAVLHAVRNLNTAIDNNNIDSDEIDAFQSMYYLRLQQWIDTFHGRCKEANANKKYRILQKFIDEQKLLLEECEKKKQSSEALLTNSCEPKIAVAALIGINVFLFRKWAFK